MEEKKAIVCPFMFSTFIFFISRVCSFAIRFYLQNQQISLSFTRNKYNFQFFPSPLLFLSCFFLSKLRVAVWIFFFHFNFHLWFEPNSTALVEQQSRAIVNCMHAQNMRESESVCVCEEIKNPDLTLWIIWNVHTKCQCAKRR